MIASLQIFWKAYSEEILEIGRYLMTLLTATLAAAAAAAAAVVVVVV